MSTSQLTGRSLFIGVEWATISVKPNGTIFPPPKTVNRDKLRVVRCLHLGPNVYCVINLNRGYNCFVQLGRYGIEKRARCNHVNCVKWRPKACKHIRATVMWHVKLMRRLARKSARNVVAQS